MFQTYLNRSVKSQESVKVYQELHSNAAILNLEVFWTNAPGMRMRIYADLVYMTFDGNGSYTEVFNIRLSYYLSTLGLLSHIANLC